MGTMACQLCSSMWISISRVVESMVVDKHAVADTTARMSSNVITFSQCLQTPACRLGRSVGDLNVIYEAWHVPLRITQGAQRRDAEVIRAAEQYPQRVCLSNRRTVTASRSEQRADRDRRPPEHDWHGSPERLWI